MPARRVRDAGVLSVLLIVCSDRSRMFKFVRAMFFAGLAIALGAASAAAQPTLSLSATVVAPGNPVIVSVSGTPGAFYALLGSSVDSGGSFSRENLKVKGDVAVIATGTLDGGGHATVSIVPPFLGTV